MLPKIKKKFISSLWSVDGEVSSKRFVSLVGFTLMCIAFIINIFVEIKLKEFIWEGMLWVVLGCLGLTVADKFNYKGKNNNNHTNFDNGTTDDSSTYTDDQQSYTDPNINNQNHNNQSVISKVATEVPIILPAPTTPPPQSEDTDL